MKRFFSAVLVLSLIAASCRRSLEERPVERVVFLMDTVVRFSLYSQGLPEKKVDTAIDRAIQIMREMESKMSAHGDTSEIAKISNASGKKAVPVSPDVFWILEKSVEVSDKSHGAFDVTIGPMKTLWGFDLETPSVPDPLAITAILPRVDYREMILKGNEVYLSQPGMGIDLGGIAKGDIVDRGVEILKEEGIESGIVEAGGDLRIFGLPPQRRVWKIGVRHPRAEGEKIIGVIETGAASIATSGDYERYFIQDGKRYHHILDPKTGYPAAKCISVTIVTENALLADAYATAVFVLGPEEGMELIKSLPSVEGIIFYIEKDQLRHVVSEGLIRKFHLL